MYDKSRASVRAATVVTLLYTGPPFNVLSEGRSVFHLT